MDYSNPESCLKLIDTLDADDAAETQARLSDMADELQQAAPAPKQHLEVLEAARDLIFKVQCTLANGYATRCVSPNSPENTTLRQVIALWRCLADSYADIMRRDASAGTLDDQLALLAQRRVQYNGQVLIEYYRAHRALPMGTWADLLESYSIAEAQGVAATRVPDSSNAVWRAQSAKEALITVLLIDIANPFGRNAAEFSSVCRWAQRFAPYCALTPPVDNQPNANRPAHYGLDLSADHGLRPLGVLNPGNREKLRFDGDRLAGQIQAVIGQIKQGVKPAALGLGEETSATAGARLLLSLYRPWGLATVGRKFPRRGAQGNVLMVSDWLGIGFHIQRKLFEQPHALPLERSHEDDMALLTFGERVDDAVSEDTYQRQAETYGFACSEWEILDQSAGGFRLRCKDATETLDEQQLIGLRPTDGKRFLLGQVSWLMYQNDGSLEAGVCMLGGIPKVVAVRQVDARNSRAAYQQGFALPENRKIEQQMSLVLPDGWYKRHRIIEIHDGSRIYQVRLASLLSKGVNYERAEYEPLHPNVDTPEI